MSRKGSAPFNRMSTHPSFPLKGVLEPIPAASQREVGSILDEAPALRSHACFLPVLGCDQFKVCSFPPFLHNSEPSMVDSGLMIYRWFQLNSLWMCFSHSVIHVSLNIPTCCDLYSKMKCQKHLYGVTLYNHHRYSPAEATSLPSVPWSSPPGVLKHSLTVAEQSSCFRTNQRTLMHQVTTGMENSLITGSECCTRWLVPFPNQTRLRFILTC